MVCQLAGGVGEWGVSKYLLSVSLGFTCKRVRERDSEVIAFKSKFMGIRSTVCHRSITQGPNSLTVGRPLNLAGEEIPQLSDLQVVLKSQNDGKRE